MIYYLCDDVDIPGGGRHMIYRHVRLLIEAGVDACVVHQAFPFRTTWTGIDVPVTWLDKFIPEEGDFIAVPEIFSPKLAEYPGCQTVAFVQGGYIHAGWEVGKSNPYRKARAAMVASSDTMREVANFYPWLEVRRVYNAVDAELFPWQAKKEKILLYNPRKNGDILELVVKGLLSRGVLVGWQVNPVYGMRQDVADSFSRAAIYLTNSLYEGFGMMPLEAGLSGCGVVGWSGFGGDEYWDHAGFMRVETGSVRKFIQSVEWAAENGLRTSQEAAAWIAREYSPERQRRSVLGFWKTMTMTETDRRVTVVIPSMGRAAQLRECIETLIANTPAELEIIVVIDQDYASVQAVDGLPVRVVFRHEKAGALSAWNAGLKISQHLEPDDLFVLGADDLVFNPGWYEEMIKTAETGDYIGLTYYERGTDRWPTHYAVTRQFMIDHLNGSLAMDAYHHNCTDLESWSRAVRGNGYVEGKAIIEHKHPAFGTAPIDQTYLDGALFAEQDDLRLYYQRKKEGFPNSWDPAIGEVVNV